jgi:hypothetical protein
MHYSLKLKYNYIDYHTFFKKLVYKYTHIFLKTVLQTLSLIFFRNQLLKTTSKNRFLRNNNGSKHEFTELNGNLLNWILEK